MNKDIFQHILLFTDPQTSFSLTCTNKYIYDLRTILYKRYTFDGKQILDNYDYNPNAINYGSNRVIKYVDRVSCIKSRKFKRFPSMKYTTKCYDVTDVYNTKIKHYIINLNYNYTDVCFNQSITLADFPNIETLSITRNSKVIGLESLTKLKTIFIETDISFDFVINNPNLTALLYRFNTIENIDSLQYLTLCTNLKHLRMCTCTYIPNFVQLLNNMSSLEYLEITCSTICEKKGNHNIIDINELSKWLKKLIIIGTANDDNIDSINLMDTVDELDLIDIPFLNISCGSEVTSLYFCPNYRFDSSFDLNFLTGFLKVKSIDINTLDMSHTIKQINKLPKSWYHSINRQITVNNDLIIPTFEQ